MIKTIIPLQKPISAKIKIPGSKSYTNRALLLAALTKNPVRIINPLMSDDTKAMISCLQTLGINITVTKKQIVVVGSIADVKKNNFALDADLSGTTIRFITALATLVPGTKKIYGKEGLNKRPIAELVEALKKLGARIEYITTDGFPPLIVHSSRLEPNTITLSGKTSSQFLSALLMIAHLIGKTKITIEGNQISKPYLAMTIEAMKNFGVSIKNNHYKSYLITKQNYKTKNYSVEGDFSSAGYFFALGALTQSTITVQNLNPNSQQADKKLLDVLEKMGNIIIKKANEITIQGKGVKATIADLTDFPDQAQTLAVLAAFAKGKTILKGIQSLRIKETERVIALQQELKKMGIKTSATKNTLTIHRGNPKAATIETYGDHRMAMSFALAGTKLDGMKINHPDVVTKTFPEFWKTLNKVGVKTVNEKSNIVLIGMRASGKSTIGKLLAKKLKKEFVDTDRLIEKQTKTTISKLIAQHGWNYFREKEAEITQSMAKQTNLVIATGGGVILKKENREALKKNGICIFLSTPLMTLIARIEKDKKRTPLTDKKTKREEVEEIWQQRKDIYKKMADIIVNTKTQQQTIAIIMENLKGKIL